MWLLSSRKTRSSKPARRVPFARKPRLEKLEGRLAPSNVPPAGITDWWTGDGSADDIIGGHNGALVGGATTGPGLVDQAFALNGSGVFVNVPDNPALNVGTGNFTVELWVNFNSTAGEQVLAEKYIETFGSSATGWTLTKLSTNVVRLALTDGADAPIDVDSKVLTIPTNTWIEFAAERSGSTITTFMNGKAIASGTCSYNLNSTSSLKLGHRGNPSDTPGSTDTRQFYLNGEIDEAQLYVGTALTSTQILGIYNDGAAGESKPMAVSRANPAAGSSVTTPPNDFTIHFSEAPASVPAASFTVNGVSANSVTQSDPNDVTFHFNVSPVTAQGLETMAMAAGSVTAADSTLPASYQPLEAWTKTFYYDAVLMQVSSTSPAANGFIFLSNPTLQITFNENYDPSTISTANLTLSQGTVTGFMLTSPTSVTYTLSGLTEGSLIATIAPGALNDSFGNPLPIGYSAYYGVELGTAPFPTPLAPALPTGSEIYQGSVTGKFNSQVPPFIYPNSGGLNLPVGAVFGPDGNVYVASFGTNSILRYNPTTGAFLNTFVFPGSGGLSSPTGLLFGSDGNLFVVSQGNNSVLRYNETTGAFLNAFVTSGSGGLNLAQRAAFGPDGNLYVTSGNSNSVLRYFGLSAANPGAPDPAAGQSGAAFVAAGSGGLSSPTGFLFGSDGNLYVTSTNNNSVLSFAGPAGSQPGAFLGAFVASGVGGLAHPTDLIFGPDGNLYVSSWGNNRVLRYNGTTGVFIDAYVPPQSEGLTEPNALLFDASGVLYVASFNGNAFYRYDGTNGGPGEVDNYTINLDANQTLALSVSSAVAATVSLSYGGSPVAAGVGGLYSIANAGTYTISVQAANGQDARTYTLQATLNAQFDTDSDGSMSAQSLAPSTLDVDAGPGIYRAAALGTVDKTVARITTAAVGVTNDLRGSWDEVGASTTWQVNNGSGVTGSLSKSVTTEAYSFYGRAGDVVTLRTKGSSSGGGSLSQALLTLQAPSGVQTTGTQVSGASSDYTIANFTLATTGTYTVTVSTAQSGKGTYTLNASLVTPANPRPNSADVYSISVNASQYLSFGAATGTSTVSQPQVQLALFAPGVDPIAGTPVATSSPNGTLDGFIDYQATMTGSYEVKVTGGSGLTASSVSYTLVAVSNGAFEANGGDVSFAAAQDITGQPGVVGAQEEQATTFVPAGSGGLNRAIGATFGPDGNLYVSSWNSNQIMRYNGTTGAPLPAAGQSGAIFFKAGSGGLDTPEYIRFGPDGNLYVASSAANEIFRYFGPGAAKPGAPDPAPGQSGAVFAAAGSGGLSDPLGLAFGPDGNLYVGSDGTGTIIRFNASGNPSVFVTAAGNGGLNRAEALTFGPDGNLYVSSGDGNSILRYAGPAGQQPGAFLGAFVPAGSGGLSYPAGLAFGPDGNLYVSSVNNTSVLSYNGVTGAFMGAFVPSGSGGLTRPTDLAFRADGSLFVTTEDASSVLQGSVPADYYKVALTAGQNVTFNTLTPGDGPGQPANLLNPHIQLYNSSQTLVATGTVLADGRNETIAYNVPSTGTYYIKLSQQNSTEGAYVLDPVESGGNQSSAMGSKAERGAANQSPSPASAIASRLVKVAADQWVAGVGFPFAELSGPVWPLSLTSDPGAGGEVYMVNNGDGQLVVGTGALLGSGTVAADGIRTGSAWAIATAFAQAPDIYGVEDVVAAFLTPKEKN